MIRRLAPYVLVAAVAAILAVVIGREYMYWYDWPCVECPTAVPSQTCAATHTVAPTYTARPTYTVPPTETATPTATKTATPTATPTLEPCRPCVLGVTDCGPGYTCYECPVIGWTCVSLDHMLGDCNDCRIQLEGQ